MNSTWSSQEPISTIETSQPKAGSALTNKATSTEVVIRPAISDRAHFPRLPFEPIDNTRQPDRSHGPVSLIENPIERAASTQGRCEPKERLLVATKPNNAPIASRPKLVTHAEVRMLNRIDRPTIRAAASRWRRESRRPWLPRSPTMAMPSNVTTKPGPERRREKLVKTASTTIPTVVLVRQRGSGRALRFGGEGGGQCGRSVSGGGGGCIPTAGVWAR